MSEPVTINLGNGFGLVLPPDKGIMMTLQAEIRFTLNDDEFSTIDCVLHYPSKYQQVKP